jgi:hypothetical protein
MARSSRALPLLLFAALAFADVRGARAEGETLVVAQAVAPEPAPEPEMGALLKSLPRDQRRAVVREMRNQPVRDRADWRKSFLAQSPAARQKQIEDWTALRNALHEEVMAMPRAERQALRERLAAMKPEERKQLRAQLSHLQQMSPEERSELRERVSRMATSTPAERARLEKNLERWNTMSPAERDRLRARWRRFQELPAAERERILQARDAKQDAQSEPKP